MRRGTVFVVLVLLLISSGCIETLWYELKPMEKETFLEPGDEVICESRAKDLIPDPLELIEEGSGRWSMLDDQKWNDGSTMMGASFNSFYRGSREGQNINFYYSFMELSYSKRIINDDGRFVDTRTFAIKPVVKPIEGTKTTYVDKYGLKREMKKFEIVDPNFVECNWVFILEIMKH